jgi:hypothetical protein
VLRIAPDPVEALDHEDAARAAARTHTDGLAAP